MERSYAPIAVFVYNRLDHSRRTLESLAANVGAPQTDVIVFTDGPKNPGQSAEVTRVRDYVRGLRGFRSVRVIERERNFGLAKSIVGGVTQVLEEYDRVIVMEDDLVASPFLLQYMNDALEYYWDDDRVASIHGYLYPTGRSLPDTFFVRGADCWSWATWRRGWALFNPDGKELLSRLRRAGLTREFDFNDAFSYTKMLRMQIRGTINSWAILWYASAFLAGKLTLYPGRSLVSNIGMDSSGTHCDETNSFDVSVSTSPVRVGGIPVVESGDGRAAFAEFGRANHFGSAPLDRLKRGILKLRQKL